MSPLTRQCPIYVAKEGAQGPVGGDPPPSSKALRAMRLGDGQSACRL